MIVAVYPNAKAIVMWRAENNNNHSYSDSDNNDNEQKKLSTPLSQNAECVYVCVSIYSNTESNA